MKHRIKNCPCCNSTVAIVEPLRGLFGVCQVVCSGCGLSSKMTPLPEEAVKLWNDRESLKVLAERIRERAIEANKNMELSDDIAEASAYGGQWLAFTEAADIVKGGGVCE